MAAPSWEWQNSASCRGEDLVLFFGPDGERQPERDVRERKAKAICAGCPVRSECLEFSLSHPERAGLWGGLNEDERVSARRRRQRAGFHASVIPQEPTVDEKRCHQCEETLPAGWFGRDKRSSDGLNSMCRPCTNEAARRRREGKQEAVA
ncbi:WhiB family transcriptional regulator [Nonomuraea sp. NPDC049714]|uniref:WhiB family transcriptional regulator n=1 Tax=Nonomuraea sp. NPDC049714 TaxID=3364357 RepID=UPI00379E67E0